MIFCHQKTPLDVALENGHMDIVRDLKKLQTNELQVSEIEGSWSVAPPSN